MTPEQKNFESLWRASQDVLRKHYFRLDRQDRRAGVLTTELMTGQYFFEFWRRDAATRTDLVESSIQTIYRMIEVRIKQSDLDKDNYTLSVRAYAFRANRDMLQVTNTSQAYNLFTFSGGYGRPAGTLMLAEPALAAGTDEYGEPALATGLPPWLVPVSKDGRDRNLEQKIAAQIKASARVTATGN